MSISDGAFPASAKVPGQMTSRAALAALEAIDEDTGNPLGEQLSWWGEYLALRGDGWDWRKAVYIAWASSPAASRQPATQEALATQVLGLANDRTIRKWRKNDPGIDDAVAMAQAAPLLRHRRDIYDALVESATNPDSKNHQDRKLALMMLGDYVPNQKLEADVTGDMTVHHATQLAIDKIYGDDDEDSDPDN